MNYKINVLYSFERELKRLGKKYRSIKNDYAILLQELYDNPTSGVHLGSGIRKMRMAKSHGARVITVTVLVAVKETEINLLFIYDKAERENITTQEIKALMKDMGLDDDAF